MKRIKKLCEIILINPPVEILIANAIIQKFKEKNNIEFDLTIALDYNLDEFGCYIFGPNAKKFNKIIFINPDYKPLIESDVAQENVAPGYVHDCGNISVACHEFAHYLCFHIYKTLIDDYKKQFPIDRLCLCQYSNSDVVEEIAEIIRLYLINPLLLKLIDEPVFKFLKNYFKSPSPMSQKYLIKIIDEFPIIVKEELKNKWKIVHDLNLNKVIKIN